jgi:hypothetical protein
MRLVFVSLLTYTEIVAKSGWMRQKLKAAVKFHQLDFHQLDFATQDHKSLAVVSHFVRQLTAVNRAGENRVGEISSRLPILTSQKSKPRDPLHVHVGLSVMHYIYIYYIYIYIAYVLRV